MVIGNVAVGGVIRAATTNQVISASNTIGLVGIIPYSVEGSGVSVSPNGQITFTGATGVSINGVFGSNFDTYRIVVQSTARSSASPTQLRLRTVRVDDATNYVWTKTVTSGASLNDAFTSSGSATSVPIDDGLQVNQITLTTIDLAYPGQGAVKSGIITGTNLFGGTMSTHTIGIGTSNSPVADGFSLFPLTNAATWSGVVRVYGYNNLA